MCGFDEPHPYTLRRFTYRTEQVREKRDTNGNRAQKGFIYNTQYVSP